MTHTEFNHPKTDSLPWVQWIEQNLDLAKKFCREASDVLNDLARQSFTRIGQESRFLFSRLTGLDFIFCSITLTVMFVAGLFLLSGLGLVSYQVFLWLKDGMWPEFPIVIVFNFLFENTWLAQWLSSPESWIGLQKIVEWLLQNIPLSVALIIPAVAVIGGMACLMVMALGLRFYQFKKMEKN
ncbi:hypothetical protein UZ36_02660 [Candidatus Nitromaritima sp. SCGC AAA799-C22]|nr:hypothetical protein UZ36_02660 [Candidatus Nitromaritima sp. SCGC AAA799-C22]